MGKISFGMEIEMLALFFFSAYVAVRGDSRYVKSCWRVQEGQFEWAEGSVSGWNLI